MQPSDTDPETERIHLALLRAAPPGRRLKLALSLSQSVIALSRSGLARRAPGADGREIGLRFVASHYGDALAECVRAELARRTR